MHHFHATVHARSGAEETASPVELAGRTVTPLDASRESLSTPFVISFEEAVARLERLPRSCVEPDGSFFYGSPSGAIPEWHVDGNLFDRNGRLLFVDLKGNCPAKEFDQLLTAIGWPATPVIFQLVREAVLLDEPEFRRLYGYETTKS